MCQINNFISHLKKVVKEEQIKLKASKRKISDQWFSFSVTTLEKEQLIYIIKERNKIIKITVDVKRNRKEEKQKINEIKCWLTKKIKQ